MKNEHEKTNFNQLVMKIIFYVNSNIKKKVEINSTKYEKLV